MRAFRDRYEIGMAGLHYLILFYLVNFAMQIPIPSAFASTGFPQYSFPTNTQNMVLRTAL